MFRKKTWNKPFSEKIHNRVKKVPVAQLPSWIETSVYEITRCMREYEKTGSDVFLKEALLGAEAVHAMVDTLHEKSVL